MTLKHSRDISFAGKSPNKSSFRKDVHLSATSLRKDSGGTTFPHPVISSTTSEFRERPYLGKSGSHRVRVPIQTASPRSNQTNERATGPKESGSLGRPQRRLRFRPEVQTRSESIEEEHCAHVPSAINFSDAEGPVATFIFSRIPYG